MTTNDVVPIPEWFSDYFGANARSIPEFQLRYLIEETTEFAPQSWCSTGKEKITVRSKPILQYSYDAVEWLEVPTVVIQKGKKA